MFRSKHLGIALSAMLVASLASTPVTRADDVKHINELKAFVDQAGISLAEAIRRAEQHTGGKATHAEVMCDSDPRMHGEIRRDGDQKDSDHQYADRKDGDRAGKDHDKAKSAHYMVYIVGTDRKITEVAIDATNGNVLLSREGNTVPAFQTEARRTTQASYQDQGNRDAQNPGNRDMDNTRGDDKNRRTDMNTTAWRIQKATDLIGKDVQNARGENLGDVEDLAVDPDSGRVVYYVLSFGGFAGMGDKWFAVPAGALTLPDHAKNFVLAVDKDRLKNASGFDKDNWPKMGDATWGTQVHEFYGQHSSWSDDQNNTGTKKPMRIQKASEMLDSKIQNDRGEDIGELENLAIDPDNGRIVYGVLSFGGFMGVGDKLFAIPAGALKIPGTGNTMVLAVSTDQLKNATGFDKDNWPNLADPNFNTKTSEQFGQKPYSRDARDNRDGSGMHSANDCAKCGMSLASAAAGVERNGQMFCCQGCAQGTGCSCAPGAKNKNKNNP